LELSENPLPAAVYVLVAEDFFWEKVDSTLRALAKRPVTPDWGKGEILEQLLQEVGTAAVIDLENESTQGIEVVRALREPTDGREPIPVLAYASYDREDLLRAAEQMGAVTVARSTFASSLVRLLQELTVSEDEENGRAEAS